MKKTTPPKKAFAYLRVSGKGQVDGDGFPRQKLAIEKYAAANRIKIECFFEEKGVTGTRDFADRPEFMAMNAELHADGVKLVLVESLGRLARDLMVQESIIADMRHNGFELVSVQEPDLCSDDPTRTLLRQMMGAFHQYEKTMIVSKLRGARQRKKAATGRCEGRKPYGELPGEAEVLGRMRELRTQEWTFDRIAAALNAEGVHTRIEGGRWFGSTVAKIMRRAGVTL